ncbi:sensor domain-containing diguanylate cyclase [Thiohalomonas denitrificans]|uniref:PAS domain S-box-containing protein/diguanylate cyclase (GGDEF) domain-containing protein n=1 Tax=Thiohalomonas denitrificans TaxID=415747 RepID=A0A1G5Q4A8_9GAMM|nr:sensor domain-containing diguanylate cyclase [Thiohalomonas denitrificans]SCZ56290.1 PAS domain S-box-containing protein/diguanylate cyclase (GGDEF) domain-containing protein [Thiohalomonas denitrificans]
MRRTVSDLLWVVVLGILLEVLFIVLGGLHWLQQRMCPPEPGWWWNILPLFTVWGVLLGWYAYRSAYRERDAVRELKRLRESEYRFMEVVGTAAEGLLLLDSDGLLLFMNQEAERLLGWSSAELANKNIHQLIHLHHQEPVPLKECGVQRALAEEGTQRVEEDTFIRKDGSRLPVSYAAAPMVRGGRITGVVVVFQDITERKRLRDELRYQATHDVLTGLVNRVELERCLVQEIERAERYQHFLSVLMVDLDHFKAVNDTYGHRTGDAVLKAFATRLNEHARRTDTVVRYGGEEFLLVLPETPIEAAMALAERLRVSLNEKPLAVPGVNQTLTASIGVAAYPTHGTTDSELLRAADGAMYAAKQSGRNRICSAVD